MVAMALAAALGGAAAVSSPAEAAGAQRPHQMQHAAVQPVHYDGRHGGPQYARHRDSQRHWQAAQRARDQARIAEAARREALRIERERAARQAWHDTRRQQYSQYRGW